MFTKTSRISSKFNNNNNKWREELLDFKYLNISSNKKLDPFRIWISLYLFVFFVLTFLDLVRRRFFN